MPVDKDHRKGITITDLKDMRLIFDGASIPRPRHCFRWNNSLERWELSNVAPVDRTLIATLADSGAWEVV